MEEKYQFFHAARTLKSDIDMSQHYCRNVNCMQFYSDSSYQKINVKRLDLIQHFGDYDKLCISMHVGFCYEKEGVTSEKSDITSGAAC